MLLALSDGFSQERRCSFGINLYGLVKGSACIHSGYAFSDHWSVSSDMSLGYSRFEKEKSDIEAEHDGEFTAGTPELSKPPDLITEHISFRYWIQQTMKGLFLSTGIRYGSWTGVDYTLGIGYEISIWKGLHITAGYTYALKNMSTDNDVGTEGIGICLCYTF